MNENVLKCYIFATDSLLFKERRRQQQQMCKEMLKFTYEKNYKLLQLAYEQIFHVLNKSNISIIQHNYDVESKRFPMNNSELQQSVCLILENCCLASENLIHFPEISYRIFKKSELYENWKSNLNWCIHFVQQLPHIVDEATVKLMEILQQEINEELRSVDYVNPYYAKANEVEKPSKKSNKKKLKKGPHMNGGASGEL